MSSGLVAVAVERWICALFETGVKKQLIGTCALTREERVSALNRQRLYVECARRMMSE